MITWKEIAGFAGGTLTGMAVWWLATGTLKARPAAIAPPKDLPEYGTVTAKAGGLEVTVRLRNPMEYRDWTNLLAGLEAFQRGSGK